MASFNNSVVLITGCSTGIGRSLSVEFAQRGHRVFATARSIASIADLASKTLRTAELDVTDGPSITRAVEECLQWAGRVDIVVNNAGYALIGPAAELDLDDLRSQFETNVVGLVAVAQAVIPAMVREVTAGNSPAVIRHGKGSTILPALGRLPVRIRDRILSRRFKLEQLQ